MTTSRISAHLAPLGPEPQVSAAASISARKGFGTEIALVALGNDPFEQELPQRVVHSYGSGGDW